jgi:hypothetical protein
MTIEFNCPNCDSLIAFGDKYIGKRAHCTSCGQIFIIPSESFQEAETIDPEPEHTEPLPGFYKALIIDCWKPFFNRASVTSLVFVIAVVCFKFFLNRAICCVGVIAFILPWGWLLGFYLNIIHETAFEIDTLPQVYLGTSFSWLTYVFKPFFIFTITLFVVQIPFLTANYLLLGSQNPILEIWQKTSDVHLLLRGLFIFGLFLFPMTILTVAVARDPARLRPDYLLGPICKAFIPYLLVVAFLVAACILELQTKQYANADIATTARDLSINFASQVLAIIAMRAIGLFYRHYRCYLKW